MTDALTPRDLAVLRLAAQGYTNREISKVFGLSEKSIEHMLGSTDPFRALYAKLGVKNRAEAAAWYTARYGLGQRMNSGRTADYLLELATDYVARIYQTRIHGHPQMAIEMAQFVSAMLEDAAQKTISPRYQEALLAIRTQALLEQGTAYLETTTPDALFRMINPLVCEIRVMAKATGHSPLLGEACVLLAGVANITKHYALGMRLYTTALDLIDEMNLTLRSLRGIAIAAAYLNKPATVSAVSSRVSKLVEDGCWINGEQVCETLEGVGKAQGLLGSTTAYRYLEQGEAILTVQAAHNSTKLPLRRLQLLVSKLEVTQRLAPTDHAVIEQLGRDGIALAHEYGYHRHVALIKKRLATSLP